MIPNVLSIAGSDPSGGAGIQADLKTFTILETYGMAVITALTAQNTMGVQGVFTVPPDFIKKQLTSIFEDIRVDTVKIGMLFDVPTMKVVADILQHYKPQNIVLDPVMVATSGDRLQEPEAIQFLKSELIPLATLITPNIPEAEILFGKKFKPKNLYDAFGVPVLLKGGHKDEEICADILLTKDKEQNFESPRIKSKNTHGTGCTLSSAIAAYLAKGQDMEEAIESAKSFIFQSIKSSDMLSVGQGNGPVNIFIK